MCGLWGQSPWGEIESANGDDPVDPSELLSFHLPRRGESQVHDRLRCDWEPPCWSGATCVLAWAIPAPRCQVHLRPSDGTTPSPGGAVQPLGHPVLPNLAQAPPNKARGCSDGYGPAGDISEERGPHVKKRPEREPASGTPTAHLQSHRAWGQRCQVTRLFQKANNQDFKGTCSTAKRESVCQNPSTGGIPPRFPSTMVSGLTLWAPERRLLCPPRADTRYCWTGRVHIPTLNG